MDMHLIIKHVNSSWTCSLSYGYKHKHRLFVMTRTSWISTHPCSSAPNYGKQIWAFCHDWYINKWNIVNKFPANRNRNTWHFLSPKKTSTNLPINPYGFYVDMKKYEGRFPSIKRIYNLNKECKAPSYKCFRDPCYLSSSG